MHLRGSLPCHSYQLSRQVCRVRPNVPFSNRPNTRKDTRTDTLFDTRADARAGVSAGVMCHISPRREMASFRGQVALCEPDDDAHVPGLIPTLVAILPTRAKEDRLKSGVYK